MNKQLLEELAIQAVFLVVLAVLVYVLVVVL